MMPSLNIALDFDGTFTADPVLWAKFIEHARELGHQVFIVTARRDTEENRETISRVLESSGVSVRALFTELKSKAWMMKDRGIRIDIWIDDDPETLVRGH